MVQSSRLATKGSQKYKVTPTKNSNFIVINITYNKNFNKGRISSKKELMNFFGVKSLKDIYVNRFN